jgi:predicted phage replisome organizer
LEVNILSEVKWIKICTDIFDDEKISLIDGMPERDGIIVIWFKLLCMAGKQNNGGVFMLNDKIAYTDEMLATIFRRPLNTVRLALSTFESFGMVNIINNAYTIPNWEKHQSLDKFEAAKEKTRLRVAAHREKQKQLAQCNEYSNVTVTPGNALDKDIDKEEDKEIDLEEDSLMVSNETIRCTRDVQRVVEAWNAIGVNRIQKITTGTNRYDWLKRRIKDYGIDSVLEAIENVRKSDFLMGRTKEGFKITFDWFIRPNNFPKVLDGNYENKTQRTNTTPQYQQPYQRTGNVFLDMLDDET